MYLLNHVDGNEYLGNFRGYKNCKKYEVYNVDKHLQSSPDRSYKSMTTAYKEGWSSIQLLI